MPTNRELIVISNDSIECLRKVPVNIGSLRAGNNSADLLKETSAPFDELYRQRKINK